MVAQARSRSLSTKALSVRRVLRVPAQTSLYQMQAHKLRLAFPHLTLQALELQRPLSAAMLRSPSLAAEPQAPQDPLEVQERLALQAPRGSRDQLALLPQHRDQQDLQERLVLVGLQDLQAQRLP